MKDLNEVYGEYGPVLVTKGQFKGEVGYYDDDDNGRAIVYFRGKLMCGKYKLLPYSWLEITTLPYVCTLYYGKPCDLLFNSAEDEEEYRPHYIPRSGPVAKA